jgi:hypothetical protein
MTKLANGKEELTTDYTDKNKNEVVLFVLSVLSV